jgi:SAM-dependent methyltransferase
MEIKDWNERYRSGERIAEDLIASPTPLLVETATRFAAHTPSEKPGTSPLRALDLACGAGRNALWLAEHGWSVTAVDGAPDAIAILCNRATQRGLTVDARIADLEKGEYPITLEAWDLIAICYYLQRDLFEPAKRGLVPGGTIIAMVHITEPGEEPTAHRLRPGELENYFQGWEILHSYEGRPHDAAHQRSVAEVVARRP